MTDCRGPHLNPSRDGPYARRAFFASVVSSDLPTLRELVAHGLISDVNMKDGDGCSPLFLAQDPSTAAFLLRECNASVRALNSRSESPLIYAARHADTTEIAKLLLDNGADVSVRDERGETALHNAGSVDMVKLLVERGASVHVRSWSNQTPLFAAVRTQRAGAVEELIESGADVHATDVYGQTAMFGVKSRDGCVPALEVLVKHGASVQVSSTTMETPLHVAASNGRLEAARFLVDHGALVDASSNAKQTPLYQAAQNGHYDIIRLLLDRGASVHGDPSFQILPLRVAVNHGHLSVIAELLARGAWLHTDQPILISGGSLPRDVEVLDLLVQHIETVVPEHPPTAGFAFNEWVWILMRGVGKVAPELKPQWTPVARKLVAFVTDLNSRKCNSNHDTWVKYGTVLFRLWKWMLEYASRKEGNGNSPPENAASPQDLETLANLRNELDDIAVPQTLVTKGNAATDNSSADPSVQLETAVGNGFAALKTFVADEIQRGIEEHDDTSLQSHCRLVSAKLHNAALGLSALHEQHVVHGELASSRSRARVAMSEDAACTSTPSPNKDANRYEAETADSLAIRWKSPESLQDASESYASDVYSFGMCILEAASSQVPWGSVSSGVVRVLASIGRLPKQPENVSDDQWQLIEEMCAKDPAKRPTMSIAVRKLALIVEQQE